MLAEHCAELSKPLVCLLLLLHLLVCRSAVLLLCHAIGCLLLFVLPATGR